MERQAHQDFTKLEVWKKARHLKNRIESIAKRFPVEEKYMLTSQIIRAVRSINANIAEGHGRFTFKDQLHFCIQERGSLSETLNHLIDAFDRRYLSKQSTEQLIN